MQRIKSYKGFSFGKGELDGIQKSILKRSVSGTWEINGETGLIDIEGSYDHISILSLSGLKFGNISGDFVCSDNINILNCTGFPLSVGGDFIAAGNKISSLRGAPKQVGGIYSVAGNSLKSLEGCPTKTGTFNCNKNYLTTLHGSPEIIQGSFTCAHNSLQNLEGGPKSVSGIYDCKNNPLESLNGVSEFISGSFSCPEFTIPSGQWNILDIIRTLRIKSPEELSKNMRSLVSTIPLLDSIEAVWEKLDQEEKKWVFQNFEDKLTRLPSEEKKLMKALTTIDRIKDFF